MHPVVDPDLHADLAHLGLGLFEAVIYVGVERVQRHSSFRNRLRPAHLDTTQPTAALDPGPLGTAPHGARERPLHGVTERGPAHELLGYRLGDEAGVELRARDLAHVDLDLLPGDALEVVPEGVHLAAALADDDAGPRGVDVHRDLALLRGLADLDVGDPRPAELLLDVIPDPEVLAKQLGEVPVRVPAALEVYLLTLALYPEPEALRVYLLTHLFLLVSGRVYDNARRNTELDGDVAGALADHGRPPHGPGPVTLYGWPLVHPDLAHEELVGIGVRVVLRVGGGALYDAADYLRRPLVGEAEDRGRLRVALAPDFVGHEPRLARGYPDVFGHSFHYRLLAIRSLLTCVLKVRVGANSPSLWPTMLSVQ